MSFDLITMGRVGVDLYPEQIGVHLADVRTFAKSLGGSATNVASPRRGSACARAVITKVGDDPFGPYVRDALRGFGVDAALGRHAPDAAHAGRLLRDLPARRLPAALLPRADGAGHDARDRRARPRRDPRGARVLDDRAPGCRPSRAARRRWPRWRRATAAARSPSTTSTTGRCSGPTRPRPARWAREALAHATVAVGNRDEVAVAVGTRDPHEASAALLELGVRGRDRQAGARRRARRARPTAWSRYRRCRSRSSTASAPATRSAARWCYGLLQGWEPARAVRLANAAGAYVASQARVRRRRCRPSTSSRRCPHETHRRPGARALPRRAATSSATASAQPFFAGCFGIFGHGNVAGHRARRSSSTPTCCPTTRPATSRRWSTSPPATRASATGSGTFACTTSVGPGATNMVTGAALATINRLPVLLLPGDTFADARAAPGAAAARGPARRDAVGQRLLPAGVALLRPHRAARAARPRGAGGDARAHRPGRDGRGHAGAARGRADRGVRRARRRSSRRASWTVYRQPPAPEALARAAELVRGAQRPLIVAGGGVIYSEATAALRAFVDATGHPGGRDAGRPRRAALRPPARRSARSARPAPRRPTGWPARPTS